MILISGKGESGKDLSATIIKDRLSELGYKVVITRYAKYLKDMAKEFCGWDGNKDEYGRKLLQVLGTDIIRQKMNKKLFHVNRICEDVEICADYFDIVIVSDCRFPDEVYLPKAFFGDKVLDIRVERPGHVSKLTDEQKTHISETALDDFNFSVVLTATNQEELEKEIEEKVIKQFI
jgi:hypothetical protein